MARNKGKRDDGTSEDVVADLAEPVSTPMPAPTPTPTPAPAVSKKVAPGTPVFTFDRWFAQTGRPTHHKAGMAAFLKGRVKGKRTVAAWDALFAGY